MAALHYVVCERCAFLRGFGERLPRRDPPQRCPACGGELVEPLWKGLRSHHAQVTPTIAHSEIRPADESWSMRRAKYARWLEEPQTFVLLAEREGEAVGYAFVTVGPGHATWASGARMAELQTLSVAPGSRGEGVGSALIDAVEERLEAAGIEEMQVITALSNEDARRFYERRGLVPCFQVLYGSVGAGAAPRS